MKRSLLLFIASALTLVAGTAFALPISYFAPGSYQGWDIGTAAQLKDDGVLPDVTGLDGIYTAQVTVATAGAYEWKAAEDGWAASWPGSGNCWFITTSDNEDVVLTFDTNAYGDGWSPDTYWPNSDRTRGATYTLVGSLGDELGGSDWDPAGSLILTDDGNGGDATAGDGIYTFCGSVSLAGHHEWKIAVNGGWAQQYGADGPGVNSATLFTDVANDGDSWCFELDVNTGRVRAEQSAPVPVRNDTWGRVKTLYR